MMEWIKAAQEEQEEAKKKYHEIAAKADEWIASIKETTPQSDVFGLLLVMVSRHVARETIQYWREHPDDAYTTSPSLMIEHAMTHLETEMKASMAMIIAENLK